MMGLGHIIKVQFQLQKVKQNQSKVKKKKDASNDLRVPISVPGKQQGALVRLTLVCHTSRS